MIDRSDWLNYSAFMLATRITLPHFCVVAAISSVVAAISARNSAGVLGIEIAVGI